MKKLTKEVSMKIGNTSLILGLIALLFALLCFFFPFVDKISGLKLIFTDEYRNSTAIICFSLYLLSLVLGALIYIFKRFPWGKILLLIFSFVIFLSAGLLIIIANKNGGLIFSFIFGLFGGVFYFVASILK